MRISKRDSPGDRIKKESSTEENCLAYSRSVSTSRREIITHPLLPFQYQTTGLRARSISSNDRPFVSTTLTAMYKTARRQTVANPKYTVLIPNLFTTLKKYSPITKFEICHHKTGTKKTKNNNEHTAFINFRNNWISQSNYSFILNGHKTTIASSSLMTYPMHA